MEQKCIICKGENKYLSDELSEIYLCEKAACRQKYFEENSEFRKEIMDIFVNSVRILQSIKELGVYFFEDGLIDLFELIDELVKYFGLISDTITDIEIYTDERDGKCIICGKTHHTAFDVVLCSERCQLEYYKKHQKARKLLEVIFESNNSIKNIVKNSKVAYVRGLRERYDFYFELVTTVENYYYSLAN